MPGRPLADTIQMQVLAAAAAAVGGVDRLAARLGVTEALVRAWIVGTSKTPEDAYVKAVVIIHAEDSAKSVETPGAESGEP